jgi:hypothetical protein
MADTKVDQSGGMFRVQGLNPLFLTIYSNIAILLYYSNIAILLLYCTWATRHWESHISPHTNYWWKWPFLGPYNNKAKWAKVTINQLSTLDSRLHLPGPWLWHAVWFLGMEGYCWVHHSSGMSRNSWATLNTQFYNGMASCSLGWWLGRWRKVCTKRPVPYYANSGMSWPASIKRFVKRAGLEPF